MAGAFSVLSEFQTGVATKEGVVMIAVWVVVGLLAVVLLSQAIFVVRQYERGVVATFGRYAHTVDPGLSFIFPFVQTLERVDMRETVLDVNPQEVITEDNVVV